MKRVGFGLSFVFLLAAAAWGQATAGMGALSGTVRDSSGAIIPGAKVVISNPSLGLTRELNTTDAGLFAMPSLVPSSGYKVSVTKEGFSPYATAELTIQVGQTLDLNVQLSIGAATQQVEVVAAA